MKAKSIYTLIIASLLLVLFLSQPALAQRARQTGIVVDESGKPMAGVEVHFDRLKAAAGNVNRVIKTGEDGKFTFNNLNGGSWRITVEHPGYLPYTHVYQVSSFSRNPQIKVELKKIADMPAAGGSDARAEAEGVIAEAEKLVAEKKFDEAIALYQEFETKYPEAVVVRVYIGDLLIEKGDKDSAIESYESVLAKEENVMALERLGNIYVKDLEYDKAREYYERLVQITNKASHYFITAEICNGISQYEDAIFYYEKFLEMDSTSAQAADAHMKAGYAASASDKHEKAIAHFEKFLEMVPNHPYAGEIKKEIERSKEKM